MNAQESWAAAFLAQAGNRFEPWMSCDETFDRSDSVLGDFLDRRMPLPEAFGVHLSGC